MRQHLLALLSAALLPTGLTTAQPARAGTAEVLYEQPDRFADAGRGHAAESVRQTLAAHLDDLARQRLPASQQLKIAITDIDLAGEVPPMLAARLGEVRVLGRPVDWPRITLRYTLQDGERVLAQGSEVVSDMAYLQRAGLQGNVGSLPYERRMLTDWFDQRFGAAAGTRVP